MNRLLTVLCALALASSFVGCGDDAASADTTDDVTTADDTAVPTDTSTVGDDTSTAADSAVADTNVAADVPKPVVKHPGYCVAEGGTDGVVSTRITRTYDAQDRVVSEVLDYVDPELNDRTSTWTYDGQGRILRHKDEQSGGVVIYDRQYVYAANGLISEATIEDLGGTLRYVLDTTGGRYRKLEQFFLNGSPAEPTYQTFEWDEANDRMVKRNVVQRSNEAIVQFETYAYKPNNPGSGKLIRRERDENFQDGNIDFRTTYTYDTTLGFLESESTLSYSRLGNQLGDPSVRSWDVLVLSNLVELRSYSVNGEVVEEYTTPGNQLKVASGDCVTTYEGEMVEQQRTADVRLSAQPYAAPTFVFARADWVVEGKMLKRECGGETVFEATYDTAGNLLRIDREDGVYTTYSYDCWD